MDIIQLSRGSTGNNVCPVCAEKHIPQNRCRYEALVSVNTRLREANSMIPAILNANKQAVQTAEQFRFMLKKADEANAILQTILAKHGDIGKTIQTEYFEELETWASKHTSQDTAASSLDTKNSTLSETDDKSSTEETMSGKIFLEDSSK